MGLQEVSVTGQDVVYKDIIEPLESVSVNMVATDKDDITLFGTPDEVGPMTYPKPSFIYTYCLSLRESTICLAVPLWAGSQKIRLQYFHYVQFNS